ncbi:MAG: endonuclease domain-containing protein [Novosphingobium sp.]
MSRLENPPRNGEVAARSADGGVERPRVQHRTVGAPASHTERARKLRREMTLPEVLLWRELRGKQMGVKFRRQFPVAGYVADFACLDRRLLIEIDGIVHDMGDGPAQDMKRNAALAASGWTVLHIPAADVLRDAASIAGSIVAHADSLRPLRPCGAPPRSGEEFSGDDS